VKVLRLALAGVLAGTSPAAREGAAPPAYTAAAVARGRYLAHAVCECFECHSPLYDDDRVLPIPGKLGSGDVLNEKTHLVAPNITPDPETGAGRWTDEQLARAIRQGIGHDGRRLSVVMPYSTLSILTDDDVHAIIAYLRSLPPVRRSLPKWVHDRVGEPPADPPRAPATPDELATRRGRGAYLAHLARCVHCHTPRTDTGSEHTRRRDMEFGGGRRFETTRYFDELDADPVRTPDEAERLDPRSFVTSPNITQDPSGIPYFDEALFIQTIRTGRVAGVRPLSRAMLWFEFRKLTDDDLGAIFEFLRSVPPVRHRVNNVDPPTYCPRCRRRHGLGELNTP
jgi:mono/diheme cytochrome c family protein